MIPTAAPPLPRRDLALVLGLALMVRAVVALLQAHPGYMDAYYYTVGAQRLAGGYGFTEPYVWNYLDDPAALPHSSHLYWMPLPSLLGAAALAILGPGYRAMQAPFVLLASLAPLLAYVLAWRVTARRRPAWLAALLLIFSGFYVPLWGVPESFAPYAVFGSLALLLSSARSTPAALASGVCAGLAHLTRTDGVLLLIPALWGHMERMKDEGGGMKRPFILLHPSSLILGYLAVMLPWFIRNLNVIGSPLSPAGTQALWLCTYDELYSFGIRLDLNHWLACGVDRIVAAKLSGLVSGLVHLIAENGLIFAAPFMAIGVWRLRREPIVRPALVYLVLLYLAMTLGFTFVGERGGLFHSSAALMPLLCAAAAIGLERVVDAATRRIATWQFDRAVRGFGVLLVALAVGLSAAITFGRIIVSGWNRADMVYRDAGAWLAKRGEPDAIVAVGNPPGFTYHTGHASIAIPNGGVDTLLAAARRFGAKFVLLEANLPAPLLPLYNNPQRDARLRLVAALDAAYLFEIDGR